MYKSSVLTVGMVGLLSACIERTDADKDLSTLEEPSSEPAGEPSDGESTDGSSGSDGSGGNSDGNSDGGSWGDGGSTDEEVDDGYINPDFLLFQFQHGQINGEVSSMIMPTGDTRPAHFTVVLFDSTLEEYCSVDWEFDENTVAPDPDYADGFVFDAFSGADLEVWNGFVVLSTPQASDGCEYLTSAWDDTLSALMIERPGFGYGPLTEDLSMSMQEGHYADWSSVEDFVFAGIASMTVFSDTGERMYFPINQGFAYPVDDAGVTSYDPESYDVPQGTELSLSDLPAETAHYVGNYYFGLSLGGH